MDRIVTGVIDTHNKSFRWEVFLVTCSDVTVVTCHLLSEATRNKTLRVFPFSDSIFACTYSSTYVGRNVASLKRGVERWARIELWDGKRKYMYNIDSMKCDGK